MQPDAGEITRWLHEYRAGNQAAADRLMPLVYQELRRLAAWYMGRERPDHTLQATALVHEVYIRLFSGARADWRDRAHFFAIAAQQMRHILVDHARAVRAEKRGGHAVKVPIDEAQGVGQENSVEMIALDEALHRLGALDPRAGRVVELRFFGGLTEIETADVLGIGVSSVKRDWDFAKAWLFAQLGTQREDAR